jgi:hypothetical protein
LNALVVGQLVTVAETTFRVCAVCVRTDVVVGVVVTVLITVAALPTVTVLEIINFMIQHNEGDTYIMLVVVAVLVAVDVLLM